MKAILLLVLSVIILSQGFGFAYADHEGNSHANVQVAAEQAAAGEVPILTIETDSSVYEEGEVIFIAGSVSDYREIDAYTNFDVTIRLIAPNNNIISISQVSLDSEGSYTASILAEGPLWKLDGGYTLSASQGPDRNASVTFSFVHSSPEEVIEEEVIEEEEIIEISEEEVAAEKCGPGTHFEDGVCILDESIESESVSVSGGSVPTEGFNSWIYSITFTLLIAFVIAILLFLISRVRGKKTV